jgi:GT2 family glycosyltransferase
MNTLCRIAPLGGRSGQVPQIDVLMTSHNRCEVTLACLESLAAQTGPDLDVRVVLVDAGSTDGTADQVAARFPDVVVERVGADVYWGGGMQLAGARARRTADFHLWLNDDVVLAPDAFAGLLRLSGPGRIVAGKLSDATGTPTYGGFRTRWMAPLSLRPVPVSSKPERVQTMNGNVVLVGRAVIDAIGGVRGDLFPHAFGDVDYGLTATRAGFEVIQAPGTVGTCSRNPPPTRQTLPSLGARWRATRQVKELPPRMWWHACRRHTGVLAPIFFVAPYVKLLRRQPSLPMS